MAFDSLLTNLRVSLTESLSAAAGGFARGRVVPRLSAILSFERNKKLLRLHFAFRIEPWHQALLSYCRPLPEAETGQEQNCNRGKLRSITTWLTLLPASTREKTASPSVACPGGGTEIHASLAMTALWQR